MLMGLLLIFSPLAATAAGTLVWVGNHGESLDDGHLVRKFLIALAIVSALLWAICRTDGVRKRLDPQYRIQTEIDANPVYSTVKKFDPNGSKALRQFLNERMSAGVTLPQALLEARSALTAAVTERLGSADQSSKLMWGRQTAASLNELRSSDPDLCYRAMTGQPLDPKTLTQVFSAENTESFQQAVVQVYESADRGMRHQYPPEDKRADFKEVHLEFRDIQADVEQEFGHSVAVALGSRKKLPESPDESAEQLCSARIYQLQQMLERPKPTAAMLIDSVLR